MDCNGRVSIELAKYECGNLATFIELYLLQEIRDNEDLDSLDYVVSMIKLRDEFNKLSK